jgi:hypothetical protein
MKETVFFAKVAIEKLLKSRFKIMAFSEDILGMMVNALRYHLHFFPGTMKKL